MLTFRKIMQATALGLGAAFLAAPLAAPRTAHAQFFDKPGFGGGFGYAPQPPFFYAPPPPRFYQPPIYYAPPQRFYHPQPPHVFYAPPPPRVFYGQRPYYGRPHHQHRHW